MTLKAAYTTGKTDVDFFARNAAGQWWNTSGTPAFEDYNAANLADYRITATETPSGSGIYHGSEPSGATEYELRYRGATLALSVIVSGPVATEESLVDAIVASSIGTDLTAIAAKTALIGTIRSLIRW